MGISQSIPGRGAAPEPLPASTCTTSSTQAESGAASVWVIDQIGGWLLSIIQIWPHILPETYSQTIQGFYHGGNEGVTSPWPLQWGTEKSEIIQSCAECWDN
jgi:hypothetical protein